MSVDSTQSRRQQMLASTTVLGVLAALLLIAVGVARHPASVQGAGSGASDGRWALARIRHRGGMGLVSAPVRGGPFDPRWRPVWCSVGRRTRRQPCPRIIRVPPSLRSRHQSGILDAGVIWSGRFDAWERTRSLSLAAIAGV